MPNLSSLDVVISLVVVLITLSLVVQSIQQLVKKALKLKSKTILGSLEDLFVRVVQTDANAAANGKTNGTGGAAKPAPPGWLAMLRKPLDALFGTMRSADPAVAAIVNELALLGRRTLFNKPMLDSIAKDDVVKVLTRLGATDVAKKYQEIEAALSEVGDLLQTAQTAALQGGASAELASLQQALAPLIGDLKAFAGGQEGLSTKILNDLLNLRHVHLQNAFKLLGSLQDRVQKDLAAATKDTPEAAGLQAVATALQTVSIKLRDLGTKVESALTPLDARLSAVELWYDTVMQGFDERYTRHMKTVGVVISIVTVIALNANFFTLYTRISDDTKMQQSLMTLAKDFQSKQPDAQPANAQPAPAATTAEPAPTPQDVAKAQREVVKQVKDYQALGFAGLEWKNVQDFWSAKKDAAWLRDGLATLFGWLLTVLFLSAGAPFWEDVLESLFGLKSLMRQKTGTRNVEEDQGGQPKP